MTLLSDVRISGMPALDCSRPLESTFPRRDEATREEATPSDFKGDVSPCFRGIEKEDLPFLAMKRSMCGSLSPP